MTFRKASQKQNFKSKFGNLVQESHYVILLKVLHKFNTEKLNDGILLELRFKKMQEFDTDFL